MTRDRAEEYRRLARECRAAAQTMSAEEARAELLATADSWERLAEQQNYGTDLSEPAAHQQQVGDKDENKE